MKNIDVTICSEGLDELSAMVGERFDSYQCDEFHFRPAVYQSVFVEVNKGLYAIENVARVVDYFGADEEVGVLSIKPYRQEPTSRIAKAVQVRTPLGQTIENIKVVNDTFSMKEEGKVSFTFSFTKAIVFCFLESQIVFLKDTWLSEDIYIYRGSEAEKKIPPANDDMPDGYDSVEFEAERKIVCFAR